LALFHPRLMGLMVIANFCWLAKSPNRRAGSI
jgi:hypothetical protein